MSNEFVLERDGLGPLTFTGELLGHVSTATSYKNRWVELSLYITDGGRYITQVVGQSNNPGEVPRSTVKVHDTAVQAVHSFVQRRTQELSRPAIDLLEQASCADGDIDEVLDAISEQPQHID